MLKIGEKVYKIDKGFWPDPGIKADPDPGTQSDKDPVFFKASNPGQVPESQDQKFTIIF